MKLQGKTTAARAAALLAAALLAACGGGGSDSGGLPLGQVDIAAADRNLNSLPHSWTVSGTVSGRTVQAVYTLVVDGASTFPWTGAATTTSKLTLAVTVDGSTTSTVGEGHFDPTTYRYIGAVTGTPAQCTVVTSSGTLPSSAEVGQSGALYSSEDHASCTQGAAVTGRTQATWSVENDGGVLLYCQNAVFTDASGADAGRESDCIEATGNGTLGTRARITLTISSLGTVVLKNY